MVLKMVNYPPYVDAYGKIEEVFSKIQEAQVPQKFTSDFIYTMLGLKSTSYRAMIPLLKKLGFIDDANIPLSPYREYRDETKSKFVMAHQIREAYKDLFSASEFAYKLRKDEIVIKLNTILGTPSDDPQTPKAASTFLELCKLADFEGREPIEKTPLTVHEKKEVLQNSSKPIVTSELPKLGICYTINLNLPATNDVEVFNAIFKSLKENLLR
jgi:hypothetical protein